MRRWARRARWRASDAGSAILGTLTRPLLGGGFRCGLSPALPFPREGERPCGRLLMRVRALFGWGREDDSGLERSRPRTTGALSSGSPGPLQRTRHRCRVGNGGNRSCTRARQGTTERHQAARGLRRDRGRGRVRVVPARRAAGSASAGRRKRASRRLPSCSGFTVSLVVGFLARRHRHRDRGPCCHHRRCWRCCRCHPGLGHRRRMHSCCVVTIAVFMPPADPIVAMEDGLLNPPPVEKVADRLPRSSPPPCSRPIRSP